MTTSRSPLRILKSQADQAAKVLKMAERGEPIPGDNGKIRDARAEASIKMGVVMDDKVFSVTLTWETIRDTSEAGLSEFILKQMRGSRVTNH